MELTQRKKRILQAIVEHYIETAEPVGSKVISARPDLDVSSATIRNEMADLEMMGLLEQPHTSAGRIPSSQGYRIYVNELMEDYRLSMQETQNLNEALRLKMKELDQVIDQAGRIVSQFTQYPAFALTSGRPQVTIRRFDLLPVSEDSFIIVVMTDTKVVKNRLVNLPESLSGTQLELLNALLNTSFTHLPLAQISPELAKIATHTAGETFGLISMVVSFSIEVLEELEKNTVHTAGVTSLFDHPEYRSLDRAAPLMKYLSEAPGADRFPMPSDMPTEILIGPENVSEALKDTSVVVASYDIGGGMRGVIGVVGPTRMDYAKITARLTYLADGLSRLFGAEELPPSEYLPNHTDDKK